MGMNMPDNIETAAVTAAIKNIKDYRLFCGVTDNTVNDSLTNLSVPGKQVPDVTENDNTDTVPSELTGNVFKVPETERLSTNATDTHITGMPPSLSPGEPAQDVNETIEGDTNSQNDTILDTTLNTTTETVDTDKTSKTDESSELNDKLLGVTKSGNGVMPIVNPVPDTTVNATEEPMDVDMNNELIETNEALHGVTETGISVMIPLHGVTDLNVLDHSYSRQNNDCSVNNPDYFATTEYEDDAIEGLLQLSAADSPLVEFPGDDSQLMPIGVHTPDAAPTDINLAMAVVTAAIENIALEETVTKTTSTVSTQTTFTRHKHRQPVEISDLDSDNNSPKKPTT